ncbi:MAG: hypothetical protein ACP5J4_07970 [Anaerolineae bacterium]
MGKSRSAITRFTFVVLVLGVGLLLVGCEGEVTVYGSALTESVETQTGLAPAITLSPASGATIEFRTQNGETVGGVPAETTQIPHLVLHRNGALTAAPERTLAVKVTGIAVPPQGGTVTLRVETQRGDPDRGGELTDRISVWHEMRWVADSTANSGGTAEFTLEFQPSMMLGAEVIPTPTDYFRYQITVTGAGDVTPRMLFEKEFAFLMEDQVIVTLPRVLEMTDGAAPDELVLYYCDMIPYQNRVAEAMHQLSRAEVPAYVQGQLAPRMAEAFRVQSDVWGFPWYEEWTSYRSGEDTERLSVTLHDGKTWFHSAAPAGGDSRISLNASDNIGSASYASLTERLMSSYQHELFHNIQRNISLHYGGDGDVSGKDWAWQFFAEGTAVLASTVGEFDAEFAGGPGESYYVLNANKFIGGDGFYGKLNKRYPEMDAYSPAIYWRFLYERCGDMQIVREALTTLYSGEVVDIQTSTDIVANLPLIMDRALASASCSFRTYRESLNAFARALYALHIEGGRCVAPGQPGLCGFYDPTHLYNDPTTTQLTYTNAPLIYSSAEHPYPAGIPSSFGMDYVEINLNQATDGQALALEFSGIPGAAAMFDVQVWELVVDSGGRLLPVGHTVTLTANRDGHLTHTFLVSPDRAARRFAVIITRVDTQEHLDPTGAYTLEVRSQ